jgi:iron complex transport system ATP-binding protein
MSRVEVRSLGVAYGDTWVLDGVTVEAMPGEWVGVIGPNGAGKSSLLKAIAGILPPTRGWILIGGTPVESIDRRRRAQLVAMVPQRPLIPTEMTVADYVLLGRVPHLGPLAAEGPGDLAAVAAALTELGLTEFPERRLGTLSGGELQRAVLARALAQRAPVMLLDEPTAALDLGHGQQVLELVAELRRREALTVISAVHDLTAAAQYCDRLVLLAGGRVAVEGDPHTVLTEENIGRYFGASVAVITGDDGRPVVIPTRVPAEAPVLPR